MLSKHYLYVCTFGKEVTEKDTMWYQEKKTTLETTEVSDATAYYMLGYRRPVSAILTKKYDVPYN